MAPRALAPRWAAAIVFALAAGAARAQVSDEVVKIGVLTDLSSVYSATTGPGSVYAAELAAQVFVTQPPVSTPTGRFVGVVGFQRLLREAPSTTLEECVSDSTDPVSPEMPLRDVAERLASYDLLALPVCARAATPSTENAV